MRLRICVVGIALGAVSAAVAGCYWSSQPQTPHRSVELELAMMAELKNPAPRTIPGARTVVFGRFDSTSSNPIGGLYDRKDYEIAPLYRTYFFKDGAIEVFEHVSDGLRAAGLAVLKDYAGHAEPTLVDASMRARDPALVTATVTALQHDQVRESGEGATYEAGRLLVDLQVRDVNGAVKLAKPYKVEGWIHYDGQTELLKLIGWKLAETLSNDPDFVRAIGGGAS